MFPYMAIILPIYVLYSNMNFINTYQGLIIAELGLVLPFSIWMMKGFCDTIDRDLEDAAYIEISSRAFIIWYIVIPLIIPGFIAVSMFCFLASWNHLLYVMLLGTDESIMTVPYGLITKYGGINSHMAIRCNELSIPAAIGVGDKIFSELIYSNKVQLNCTNNTLNLI